ncbi:unnamed protein product [Chrysoparadoxa australica]
MSEAAPAHIGGGADRLGPSIDPDDYPEDAEGVYYELEDREIGRIFPEGLPLGLEDEVAVTGVLGSKAVMIRPTARKLIRGLKMFQVHPSSSHTQRAFVIKGGRGLGKSCALAHAVHYARSNGWVVFYIPRAWRLMHKGLYVQPTPGKEGMYDCPVNALSMLTSFKEAHSEQAAQILVKDPETIERRGGSAGSMTVLDVIEQGMGDETLAPLALTDLKKELDTCTEFPVLIAIDEYNSWFQPTSFQWGTHFVDSHEVTNIVPFMQILPSGMEHLGAVGGVQVKSSRPTKGQCKVMAPVNGLVMCASTSRFDERSPTFSDRTDAATAPWNAWAQRYTEAEFTSAMQHYRAAQLWEDEAHSEEDYLMLRAFTDHSPLRLRAKVSFDNYSG